MTDSLSVRDLARNMLYKVTVLYGTAGTGKTYLFRDIISHIIDINLVDHVFCWAEEYSINSNMYGQMFTDCRSDFKNFSDWYSKLEMDISNNVAHANQVLGHWPTVEYMFRLMPMKVKNRVNKDIASRFYELGDELFDPKIPAHQAIAKRAILPALSDNRDFIYDHHKYKMFVAKLVCNDACGVCRFGRIRRQLVFVDDFAGVKEVMSSKFKLCPTKSRHMKLTIVMLAQSYIMIPTEFRSNVLISIFTSKGLLNDMLHNAAQGMNADDKKVLRSKMAICKKRDPHGALLIDYEWNTRYVLGSYAYPNFKHDNKDISGLFMNNYSEWAAGKYIHRLSKKQWLSEQGVHGFV